MSAPATNIASPDASLVWQQLTERIDALVSAWETATEPPPLCDYLPTEAGALRRLTLLEAIKIDLEFRWLASRWPKKIEDYLAEFPELATDGGIPCDVIYEEFHIRRQHGDAVNPEEYCRRFPGRANELRRLMGLESPVQTTALVHAQRAPVFQAGQRVEDFELIKPLGKGAFATVFLARQVSMQRLVALKISRDRGSEPQTLAQLEHPHIVRVYDQRQLDEHKMRLLYMQYVPAGTLADIIEHARQAPVASRRGALLLEAVDEALVRNGEEPPTDSLTRHRLRSLSWPEVVCWLGARLAGALAYAHQRGVLHRDVKPANVLVGADGHPKLADFNISFSKIDGATPAAYFGGSLAYMSPEQLEAFDPAHTRQPDELDQRSDVYSLGVVLWELLTARRPFTESALNKDWSQALKNMTDQRRVGVSAETRAQVPRACPAMVVEALLKCLAPDPDKRYASAGELARELDLCLQPRAHALLRGELSWRGLAKRHPVTSTIAIGLLPNVVFSAVNVAYNYNEIMKYLGTEDQRIFLKFQIVVVNLVAYSIGLGYIVYTRGTMLRTLARLARGAKVEQPPKELERQCLTLGTAAAWITTALWAASALVIPGWLRFGAGATSEVTAEHFRHFIVSNLLCGMIAATQTYYVATFFSLRYCFPWLLEARTGGEHDGEELAGVARRGKIVLALAVLVPFMAIPAAVLINFNPGVIIGLGVLGLAGCGLAYFLDLSIRGDISALAGAISPGGDPLLSGDTVESFLGTSRRQ